MTNCVNFLLACPRCHAPLEPSGEDELCCTADHLTFTCVDGIWRMLLPERAGLFQQFIQEYETVRRAEGRGSSASDFYRCLPYRDLTGNWSPDWRIRAGSFDAFLKQILLPFEQKLGRSLAVLDLGSGNGWLSNQIALRGHRAAAVDLLVNDLDGLGCHRYYTTQYMPVQAEFDHLPFANRSASLILYNASFHYSLGYETSLREALRVLEPHGSIILLDSPFYHDAHSGERMVRERESQFVKKYGFASNSLPSENFLTYQRLTALAAELKLGVKRITPFYGPRWTLRMLKAWILGRREPAKFHLIILTPEQEPVSVRT